ncbi:cyclic nucleotide-binding domain-containing protein [Qaidamihabitans albus]|uniref:cyclic nucleotide-binding domain-containing protein n=1 Tax=Qaidamihabitans albus TaxID=2795733 RepID=UPI003558F9FB
MELSAGSGRRRAVVHVLQPGDVDGDIQHLLGMPLPYTARALEDATVLSFDRGGFSRACWRRACRWRGGGCRVWRSGWR